MLIRPGDIVMPVCHEGMNRSQTLFVVLECIARLLAEAYPGHAPVRVLPPHGAETGCDPHSAYQGLTEENYFEYLYSPIRGSDAPGEWQHQCHLRVFRKEKAERIGYRELVMSGRDRTINPTYDGSVTLHQVETTRQEQRALMNRTWYNPEWIRGNAMQQN